MIFVSVFGLTWILRTRLFGGPSLKRPVAVVPPAAQIEIKKSLTPKVVSNLPEGDEEAEGPLVHELPPFPAITEWGRNPFLTPEEVASLKGVKLPAAKEPSPPIAIKSIIIQGSSRVAAIDDSIVTEGEMVGEERVVEIRENGVRLARGDEVRFVEVPKPSFSRRDKPGS
ncbi:MAG: hypothetical protein HYZ72_06800 [Deltaproteobacteria bacterium]|nr:hypothetical protein [Deltaproteobacteria bacterium]